MIALKDGTEIPLFPLGVSVRMAIYEAAIDSSDKPAAAVMLAYACVGFQWEAAAALEAGVPVKQRSIPAVPWAPWKRHGSDIYAYGAAVCDALEGQDLMALRLAGISVINRTIVGLQPPAEAIEEASKNFAPEAGTSATSSGSESATSETPSPS